MAVRDEILDEAIPSDDDIEVVHLALLVRNRLPQKRRIGVKLFKRSLDPKTNEPLRQFLMTFGIANRFGSTVIFAR